EAIVSHNIFDVAHSKAIIAYAHLKQPVVVESTGLEFNAMTTGFPGAMIDKFIRGCGGHLSQTYANTGAKATTVVRYYDGKEFRDYTDSTIGTICDCGDGAQEWWDNIFVPSGSKVAFSEC